MSALAAELTRQDQIEHLPESLFLDQGQDASAPPALTAEVKRRWLGSTGALAAAVMVERGTGLLANVLAARLGGAGVFGSYSLAISTANNIGTYAAGGIGATATRFSGKYPFGSGSYGTLAQSLAIVSLVSAALAAAVLWGSAGPLSHLLGKPAIAPLLAWASLSAAGMIVLECARGFFVGQRRIASLLMLSGLVGAGLLVALPTAAHAHSATAMVVLQAAVCGGAVLLCILLGRRMGLRDEHTAGHASGHTAGRRSLWPMLREVWSFGFVQLGGMVAANLAGWWLTTLIARSDRTLVQVGFFAIASQIRNLAGIVPGLLTEGSYAVMAVEGSAASATQGGAPHRVMAISGFASLMTATALAAVGIIVAPWLLRLLYGPSFASADVALAMALALAVAHMSNAPASARLTIVSLRATGAINTTWAVVVAVAATALLLRGGSAWQGLAILLGAHLVSAALVLLTLRRMDFVPAGVAAAYVCGAGCTVLLAVLALLRAHDGRHAIAWTGAMLLLAMVEASLLFVLGRKHHWMPSRAAMRELLARAFFWRRGHEREVRHV